jgi:nucleoside-diphosphate-sugar epimerase
MATPPSATKILVTGANGFIGLHTTLHLLKLGYSVHASVRTETNDKDARETLSVQSFQVVRAACLGTNKTIHSEGVVNRYN